MGGSDPTNFLGGSSAKKWGSLSRPFWCFFHGDFRLHLFANSHASKKLFTPQTEELAEDEAEGRSSYLLHLTDLVFTCVPKEKALEILRNRQAPYY